MATSSEHHLEWNDRLQDWLDGDVDAAESALVERHLADCAICQERLADFEQLDAALREAAPRIALDDAFDRRIFAQTEVADEAQRSQARERANQELQQNLRALSRGWRRTLAFIVPGIVAGVAIAFGLASWLDDAGLTREIIAQAPSALGQEGPTLMHWYLTALLGATLGMIVARWLASVVESQAAPAGFFTDLLECAPFFGPAFTASRPAKNNHERTARHNCWCRRP